MIAFPQHFRIEAARKVQRKTQRRRRHRTEGKIGTPRADTKYAEWNGGPPPSPRYRPCDTLCSRRFTKQSALTSSLTYPNHAATAQMTGRSSAGLAVVSQCSDGFGPAHASTFPSAAFGTRSDNGTRLAMIASESQYQTSHPGVLTSSCASPE